MAEIVAIITIFTGGIFVGLVVCALFLSSLFDGWGK